MRKRLVLFTEGSGDVRAALCLAKRLLSQSQPPPWDCLFLDECPMRVGGIERLTGRHSGEWHNKLRAAANRSHLGGVLLLLDGDATKFEGQPFCAASAAADLASRSREVGGGTIFSVACVFARQEYESWLMAGAESLAGRALSDGRPGIKADAALPAGTNAEDAPRDAKKWLSQRIDGGYKPTTHQLPLTEMVNLDSIIRRSPRSFLRLVHAFSEIAAAIKSGNHIATPSTRQSQRPQ